MYGWYLVHLSNTNKESRVYFSLLACLFKLPVCIMILRLDKWTIVYTNHNYTNNNDVCTCDFARLSYHRVFESPNICYKKKMFGIYIYIYNLWNLESLFPVGSFDARILAVDGNDVGRNRSTWKKPRCSSGQTQCPTYTTPVDYGDRTRLAAVDMNSARVGRDRAVFNHRVLLKRGIEHGTAQT